MKLAAMGGAFMCMFFTAIYTLSPGYRLVIPAHTMYVWISAHGFMNLKAACEIWVLAPPAPIGRSKRKTISARNSLTGSDNSSHAKTTIVESDV